MLESEWMRSQRLGRGTWPAVRTQFPSRATIEKALVKLKDLFRLTLTHQASTHWRAHSFPIACRNHGSRVHFFRWGDPVEIIE
jgi:hypothetical protein